LQDRERRSVARDTWRYELLSPHLKAKVQRFRSLERNCEFRGAEAVSELLPGYVILPPNEAIWPLGICASMIEESIEGRAPVAISGLLCDEFAVVSCKRVIELLRMNVLTAGW